MAGQVDVTLRAELFDIDGNSVTTLDNLQGRSLEFVLNDVDTFSFTMWLDDPQSELIHPVGEKLPTDSNPGCVVKVWRDVAGLAGYDPTPRSTPIFCGYVGSRTRNANTNTQTFIAYSPFWRLQHRFHVDIHDFTVATGIGHKIIDIQSGFVALGRDPSEMMAAMITYTSTIYFGPNINVRTRTGIQAGHFVDDPPLEIDPGPCVWADYLAVLGVQLYIEKRYERGQNTWELIQDIVAMPGMPDLKPRYYHTEGDEDMLIFDTVIVRGEERPFALEYNYGSRNLDDITEQNITDPQSFANHVVVQGQGDREVDTSSARADGTTRAYPYSPGQFFTAPNNIEMYGIYQRWEKLDNATDAREREAQAVYTLARTMWAPTVYTPTFSPAFTQRFKVDFDVGDTVLLNVDRNAFQVGAPAGDTVRKRISKVTLAYSEPGDMETVGMELVEDYEGIVH